MAQQIINVGTAPNDGLGDPLRTAFTKTNNNFSQLFATSGVSGIANGSSNVNIPQSNGNVVISSAGTANVITVTGTGVNVAGTLNSSGLATLSNLSITGTVISTGTIQSLADVTAVTITASGNLSANNAVITGNVTGGLFTGNGAGLTGVIATGNVGAATQLTNGTTTMNIPVANGNLIGNVGGVLNIFTLSTGGLEIAGIVSVSGNVTGGNIRTGGVVSATGNITGNYILGNGAFLSGVITSVANINNGTSNVTVVSSGGNIAVGVSGNANVAVFDSTGQFVQGTISASGNIQGATFLTGGVVSATGNVTGGNVIGGNLQSSGTAGESFSILGSTPTVANTTGGTLTIQSGAGNGANIGGTITIKAGNSGSSTTETQWGGDVLINAGNTTGDTGRGGNVKIFAGRGNGNATFSGLVQIVGGRAEGGSGASGGSLVLYGGTGNTTGLAGQFSLVGGTSFGTDKSGQDSIIKGALGTGAGTPGNILIQTGTALASGNTAQTGSNVAVIYSGGVLVTGIVSASGNVTGGNLLTAGLISATGNVLGNVFTVNLGNTSTAIINGGANAVGNIGSSSNYFNQVFAQATTALYADLAEIYSADAEYPPGTVVSFGGDREVTKSVTVGDPRVAGVISDKPSYLMNSGLDAEHRAAVALTGRVPTLVIGPVAKGDMMVSAGNGWAQACTTPAMGTVIGKALVNFDGDSGIIEIVVGRM